MKSGRFWEADKDALKGYFNPPFDKNYLADVSPHWRAALFLECGSVSYKSYAGNWGHKLVGTGSGYLCGIDDNGDEWGFVVGNLPQSSDGYGSNRMDTTVEEAMAEVFDIRRSLLDTCTRQGDLLFCPVKIRKTPVTVCAHCGKPKTAHSLKTGYAGYGAEPTEYLACGYSFPAGEYQEAIIEPPTLKPAETWTPREAHDITSPSLRHNGRYFAADDPITITHTSHATVTLPAGEYRLYMSRMADDAD